MTRHFLALALDLQADPLTGESMEVQAARSPEEDAQAAVEATTELNEAVQASADIDHFSDVADALEDAGVILDSVQTADPQHVALAQTITNMAVAGQPDVQGSDIAPSLENYIGRRLSTEGFKDAAKRIWETIKRWAKKIWQKIEGFFYKQFGRIPRMRKSLETAEKQLTEAESKPQQDKKVDLTSGLSQMLINNTEAKDFGTYVTALGNLGDAVHDVFKTAGDALSRGGEGLADAMSSFDVDTAEASLGAVSQKLAACAPDSAAMKAFKVALPAGVSTANLTGKDTGPLPGNIVLRSRKLNGAGAGLIEKNAAAANMQTLRSAGVVAVYPDKAKETPNTISVPTPSIDSVRAAIGTCRKMLDEMETFYRGKSYKDLKAAQDKITKAGDKVAAAVSRVKPEDLKESDLSAFRQATGAASTFVQSALKTFAGVSTSAMTSCSFVCTVASKVNSAHRMS